MHTGMGRGFVLRWEEGLYWGEKRVCTEVGFSFAFSPK